MKYLMIGLFLVTAFSLPAQDMDKNRMRRDLEIAEDILSTLLRENEKATGTFSVEGSYLEGYGVLFSISRQSSLFIAPSVIRLREEWPGQDEGHRRDRTGSSAIVIGDQDTSAFDESVLLPVAETFFADYAQLITQLKPNDRICIKYNSGPRWGQGGLTVFVGEEKDQWTLSAVAGVSDIRDFQSGKISRQQLVSRIAFKAKVDSKENKEKDKDLTLLSSIFHRLYQSDLSPDFYLFQEPSYERVEGLGAILQLTMNAGGIRWRGARGFHFDMGENRFRFRQQGNNVILMESDDEDDENVEEEADEKEQPEVNFDEFLEGFQRNVVEYSGTVKSLAPNEVLIFRIRFSGFEDIPDSVEITTKQSTLQAYQQGRISLDEAVSQLQVSK